MHVKTIKQDYDCNDPRTWPLILDIYNTENGTNYKKSKTLPAKLAYQNEIAKAVIECRPMQIAAKTFVSLNDGTRVPKTFIDYPYNFDSNGNLRQGVRIPPKELDKWMKFMMTSKKHRTTLATIRTFTNDEHNAGTTSKVESSVGIKNSTNQHDVDDVTAMDFSPDAAYEQIMKSLAQPEDLQLKTIDELKEALKKAEEEAVRNKSEAMDHATTVIKYKSEAMDHARTALKLQEALKYAEADSAKYKKEVADHGHAFDKVQKALIEAEIDAAKCKRKVIESAASQVAMLSRFKEQAQKHSDDAQKIFDKLHATHNEELKQETFRTMMAEQELQLAKSQHEEELAEEVKRTDAATEEVKVLNEELEKYQSEIDRLEDELQGAKQQLMEANKKILAIWTGMQKAQSAEARKRQIDDVSVEQQKKAKVDA
jgi:hypothetical protein